MKHSGAVRLSLTTAIFFLLILSTVKAITDETGTGTTGDIGFQGTIYARQITASASGALETVGLDIHAAAGNMRLAIYSDVGGVPTALLGESASTAIAGTGFQDAAVTGVSIVATAQYWLAFQLDNSGAGPHYDNAAKYEKNQAYGAYPNPLQGSSSSNYSPHMRMTYTAAAPTPIPINIMLNWLKNKDKIWCVLIR